METLQVAKMTWLAARHTPSDRKLANQKLMLTFSIMNYHTISNFRRLHLLIWIGNTSDIEITQGAATLPNPKPGIICLWMSTGCFICDGWTDTKHTITGWRGTRGVTPNEPTMGDYNKPFTLHSWCPQYRELPGVIFCWARAEEKIICNTPQKHISSLR